MMGPAWCAVLAVLLAAAGPAAGRFVVEKNSVSVTSPEALKGKYECAIGNFGVPQYGGTLQGWVVYPKNNKDACKEFETSFKSHKSGERPNFVLIDRGECFFTTKAWNAQLAGAAAILVVDSKDEPLITMDNPEEYRNKSHGKHHYSLGSYNKEIGRGP
ncbi:hypothetical protein ACQ4PT_035370 [Festuca glaucescens]